MEKGINKLIAEAAKWVKQHLKQTKADKQPWLCFRMEEYVLLKQQND